MRIWDGGAGGGSALGGGGPWAHGGRRAMGTGGGGPWTDSKSASTMYSDPSLATELMPNTYTFWAYISSYGTIFIERKDSIVLVCHDR